MLSFHLLTMGSQLSPLKEIYIVKSRHLVPSSKPEDPDYQCICQQLDIARSIVSELIERKSIDRFFYDGMHLEEAETWNGLLTSTRSEFEAIFRNFQRRGATEDQLDHFRWIDVVREVVKRTGVGVRFYETEPKEKVSEVDDLKKALLSVGVVPLRMQVEFWMKMLGKWFLRKKVTQIDGLGTVLRDRDSFPLIQENSGPRNLLYVGRDHYYPDLFKRNSGFKVVEITLDDDLSYHFRTANRGEKLVSELTPMVSECVQRNSIAA